MHACEAFTRKGRPCRKKGEPRFCHVHMDKSEPTSKESSFDRVPLHIWHGPGFQQALGIDGAARLCCSSKALAALAAPTLRRTLGCPIQVLAHLVARTAEAMMQLQKEVRPLHLPYLKVKLCPSASLLQHVSVQIIQHPKRVPSIYIILFDRIRRQFSKYDTTGKMLTAERIRSVLLPRSLQCISAAQEFRDSCVEITCHVGSLQSMGCQAHTLGRLLHANRYPPVYGNVSLVQSVSHKINLI